MKADRHLLGLPVPLYSYSNPDFGCRCGSAFGKPGLKTPKGKRESFCKSFRRYKRVTFTKFVSRLPVEQAKNFRQPQTFGLVKSGTSDRLLA